jgi:hypothetical protein
VKYFFLYFFNFLRNALEETDREESQYRQLMERPGREKRVSDTMPPHFLIKQLFKLFYFIIIQ